MAKVIETDLDSRASKNSKIVKRVIVQLKLIFLNTTFTRIKLGNLG